MKLKYVVFDGALPVVFGEYFKHCDVFVRGSEATSAGFCTIEQVTVVNHGKVESSFKVECFGESTSLKLKTKPNDCRVLTKVLNDIF